MQTPEFFAFVLMPFANSFDDVYRLGIKETATSLGIRAERVDEQIYAEGMLERIYRQIDVADVVIADMSGQNANVFYEVGYAHGKDKLCIHLTNNAADIPFDLKHRRHIVYGSSIQSLREQLSNELVWAKTEIEKLRNSNIKVQIKHISADLDKDSFAAIAKVSFVIDLLNHSELPAPEIEAVYFYTGKAWRVLQDDIECSSTESDIPTYTHRFFLKSPIKRLPKGSWAQLRFRSTRVLGWAHKGDELKDSYQLSGTAVLRLVTSRGHFDHEIKIDVVAEALLF